MKDPEQPGWATPSLIEHMKTLVSGDAHCAPPRYTPEEEKKAMADFQALFHACRRTHRGAGGAAICICGEGCGGSAACSALNRLKSALRPGAADEREMIRDLLQWQ